MLGLKRGSRLDVWVMSDVLSSVMSAGACSGVVGGLLLIITFGEGSRLSNVGYMARLRFFEGV